MEYGTITYYHRDKRFGFIKADTGGLSFYFNVNQFAGSTADLPPAINDRVIFTHGRAARSNKNPSVSAWDFDPYRSLSGICHKQLEMTLSDGSRYIGGFAPTDTPDLSEGMRIEGSREMYHSLRIHRNDVPHFVERVRKWERAKQNGKTVLIYMSADSYFCSSVYYEKEDVPEGFEPKTARLPLKIMRQEHLPDGIVETGTQFMRYLGYIFVGAGLRKHIPNPNPNHEPSYSGYYKNPE